jgi:aldehyde:ferredoxin oxidoreductase
MPYGYNGKILHINLTDGTTWVETPDEIFYRTYMGGGCLGAYYLLKETKPGIDPLGPDNILVLAPSILTGAPGAGFSRHAVVTKSPLSGVFLDSQAGGFWGPELKFSGYDAVIIKGKSPKPVYLWIKDGAVEIRDAAAVWGKNTGDSQEMIRKELDEPKARMLLIGQAGENLVRFACIINELKDANGRGGSGAVMGSKNLKAVVCRGTQKFAMKDPVTFMEHAKWFNQNFEKNPANRGGKMFGTSEYVEYQMDHEEFPTRNFQSGHIESGEALSGLAMKETILIKNEGCYACSVACKRVVKSEGKYAVDPQYGGPEYETCASLGSDCGIVDLVAVAKGSELCNKYALDTISTGVTIAFAMECFEKGLLTLEDTDGLTLKFGDADIMLRLIEVIAHREGKLGNLLAEGSLRAAQKIGKGAEKYAMHTRGVEIAMHDARAKSGVGLGYAVGAIGGDHVVIEHDTDFDEFAPELFLEQVKSLGLLRRLNATVLNGDKIRNFVYLQNHFSFMDTLTICVLTFAPVRSFTMKMMIDMMDAITGWENSLWEVMKAGERRTNLARVFNYREGLRRKDDTLPDRMFEPLQKKMLVDLQLDRKEFDEAIDLYYEMMNWDKEGKPRKAKLIELDVAWAMNEIYE